MFYLIDGYNLLHALGMVRRQLEPAGLERARRALLEFLKKAHGEEASAVTVVFDAAKRRRAFPPTSSIRASRSFSPFIRIRPTI